MIIEYSLSNSLPTEPALTSLVDLLGHLFNDPKRDELRAKLEDQAIRTGILVQLAVSDQLIIGCKLGYEQKPDHFYSWLGGVHADFRGRGIAAELMRQQHDWCRQKGYHTIRTQTYNKWREMLILNLRLGFDVIGTVQGKHGLTIVLEKKF